MIGLTDQSDYSICHLLVRLFIHTVDKIKHETENCNGRCGEIYFEYLTASNYLGVIYIYC